MKKRTLEMAQQPITHPKNIKSKSVHQPVSDRKIEKRAKWKSIICSLFLSVWVYSLGGWRVGSNDFG